MEKRISINDIEPQAYKPLLALETYLQNSNLNARHLHLIKIRASQINKCAFCIDMHTKAALESGETNKRLFLLSAWNETTVFSEEEQAILAMTEEITLINEHGLSDTTYKKALELFGEDYVSQIIMAIVAINGWNRIAVSTNMGIEI